MGIFNFIKKDDYNDFYDDNYDDNNYDPDLDDNEDIEEKAEELKAEGITAGDCPYCGGHLTMHYDGAICFICSNCNWTMHEDIYYYWLAGGQIEMDE